MLNDFLISRDATAHLIRFLDVRGFGLPGFREELARCSASGQVSYAKWWHLLEELDALLGERALGIKIGSSVRVEHCGVLGYLFRTSKNVLEALACYQRFERLLYSGGHVQGEIGTDQTFCLSWNPEDGLSTLLSDSLLLAALLGIIREILNDQCVAPLSVSFAHPVKESDMSGFCAYFACPVKQDAGQLSICFSLDDLQRSIPFYDSTLHALLGQQAQNLVEQLPEGDVFIRSLREAIVQSLNEGCADAEQVARSMKVSLRTLHRTLQKKEKVYRDVLRDVRMSLAKRYLADASISLTEVAMLLGYSEQSAFNRAFKGWFGETPRQYRNNLPGA